MKYKILSVSVAGYFFVTSFTACRKNEVKTGNEILPTDTIRRHYKDGEYTAVGEYGNLPSHITVRITLASDTVRTVNVTPHATDPTSLNLQQLFAAAVPAVVVGKHIDDVNVGRLAGSTGTPKGFNDAIAQIKVQAAL